MSNPRRTCPRPGDDFGDLLTMADLDVDSLGGEGYQERDPDLDVADRAVPKRPRGGQRKRRL